MSALKLTWIMQSLSVGGVMQVEAVSFDPMIYTAHMRWSHVLKPIIGKPARAITDAINNLNEALEEDCANEMIEKGQA